MPIRISLKRELAATVLGYYQSTRSAYDATAGKTCLTELSNAAACGPVLGKESCLQAYAGSTQLGQSCVGSDDCAPHEDGEVVCDVSGDSTCVLRKRGAAGDPCHIACHEATGSCSAPVGVVPDSIFVTCYKDDGLRCDSTSGCVPLRAPGETCNTDLDCPLDHQCDWEEHTCVPTPSPGEPCDTDRHSDCGGSAYCTDSGVCASKKADGEPCTDLSECSALCVDGFCVSEFLVGLDSVCGL